MDRHRHSDQVTTEMAPARGPVGQAPVTVALADSVCSACGVAMAPDQRYCVECGQRRGGSRLPAIESPAIATAPARTGGGFVSAWQVTSATTAIAVIGTLLLAMGIGVFIGRSGRDSVVRGAGPQVVTVVSSGGGAPGAATTTGAAAAPSITTATTPAAAKPAAAAKTPPAPPAKAPPAAVKVGSPGSGPGYTKGKFTGNFFG